MEIERKFLLNSFPDVDNKINMCYVKQGYLSTEPEIRIRSKSFNNSECTTVYYLTLKSSGNMIREEAEMEITRDMYEYLEGFIKYPMIEKRYLKKLYNYDGKAYIIEFNIVNEGKNNSFMYAEIEFNSEEEANSITNFPDEFGEEITDNPEYKMKNYWKRINKIT